jgi:glutamate formiminotransferase/glutamate formiminotransferase/formiminotetrahydrofolate cyclodeaminase
VTLLAVPNVSEGRDRATIDAVASAFSSAGARLLDVHSDPDHHRSVFTLAGEPGVLAGAVLAGTRAAIASVNLSAHDGIHPRVGAVDVAPIVYLDRADRGAACAEALVLADLLGAELALPVFLYGELAQGRTRAELRRGGPVGLADRVASGELRPDFGPPTVDPEQGAVLVAARPPLVAFNVELAPPATLEVARAIAARIRESGAEGLAGVRAIGLWLETAGVAQISTNIEDYRATPPAAVVAAIERHARPSAAELVGLAPRGAFEGFPEQLPMRNLRLIEDALAGTA